MSTDTGYVTLLNSQYVCKTWKQPLGLIRMQLQ